MNLPSVIIIYLLGENQLKKTLLFILILLSSISLSGCTISIFEKEIPKLDEYSISDIDFFEYIPSLITEYSNITEEELNHVTKANILVRNINYNNIFLFSSKWISSGSGTIFHETDDYYYAITNHHVIEKARDYEKQTIEVYDHNHNKYNAFFYDGSLSPSLDLAIIVFAKDSEELTVLPIHYGLSGYGAGVIVISNPLDKRNIITTGKVRRYEQVDIRNDRGNLKKYNFMSIVHTAVTKKGSSGSMLLNHDLKLIGINFAGTYTESFAIPGDVVVEWLTELIYELE